MMKKSLRGCGVAVTLLFWSLLCLAQTSDTALLRIEQELAGLEQQRQMLLVQREGAKLKKLRLDLQNIGLPNVPVGDTLIWHQAMALAYAEPYEQARWVAHAILPDVVAGAVGRTNDFRPDLAIASGSAVEGDYFLKFLKPDSSYRYEGFGYDRGHLAPSADFRWSGKALSESYLYSNMSPQLDSFNRGIWGDLEDKIREYVYQHQGSTLFVVTGPVLTPDLSRIERGVNKVAIPKLYWKVVLDASRQKSLGFVVPNAASNNPLETFSVSVDSVERLTGLSFFPKLPPNIAAEVKRQRQNADWFAEVASGDVEPVPLQLLKRGQINTLIAQNNKGIQGNLEVVGKVVSGRVSRAGNVLLNLDKQYPNDLFSVFIKKEDLPNFGYDILPTLKGKNIAVRGKLGELGGKAIMYISRQKDVDIVE